VQLNQFRVTASADLGFAPAGLYAAPLDLAEANATAGDAPSMLRTVQANLAQASGVTSVGLANGLPLDSQIRLARVTRDGLAVPVRTQTTRISPTYLDTLGVRIIRGRNFIDADRSGSELIVLISQTLASRLFPDSEPIGQRITFGLEAAHLTDDVRWPHQSVPSEPQPYTVIGVTSDVVTAYMGPSEPQLFVPLAQHPAGRVFVVARSTASHQAMATAFERAVSGIYPEPDVIGANIITGERLVRSGRGELIFGSVLSAIAAAAALLLAALGIFGVVGFMVATRTREIGIRIALGASRRRVLRDVLTDSVKLAMWGVAAGLALAFVWAREIAWSDADGFEALVYVVAAVIALAVALIAGLPAARRAAAVEPIIAMRAE
jgi:putative ABC transport system permease protein